MTTAEKKQVEAVIAKWYWQPVDGHNFRYKYAVRTQTRYYESVPVSADLLKLIIEYLREQKFESTTDESGNTIPPQISLLGKLVDLEDGWIAQDAWYQTAASDEWQGTKSAKVRIYQTIQLGPSDETGDGPYTVEDGCQYAVDHTFYWNVAELPTLHSSSSGIQYTMQAVTRDSTTGLFSCVIEKRERVQQDVALYDTAKTAFEERQEEQHIGVKQASVATTGQTASVGGGVIVQRKVTKNPDCTSDVQNEVIIEVEAQNALVETRKTLRGKVTVTKHRNQSAALSTTGIVDGETRRSEKTPGKLFDNTTEITEADTGSKDISHGCQKTPVVHTDTTVESVPVTQSEDQHVTAEPNKEKEVSYRKNEDGVTKDKTTVVREYTPTEGEGGSKETYVETEVEHGEHVLAADVPTLPTTPTANEVVEVDIRQNDHGSFSTTKRKTTYKKKTGGGTTNSGNGVVTTTTERKENSTDETPTETAAPNKVVDIDETPNDHGSKTTVKRVTTYTPTEGEGGSKETYVETEVEHGEHVLAADVPTLPTTPTANEVVEVDIRPNDHGSFSTTKRKTTYKKKTGGGTTNSGNGVVTTTTERKENSTDETPTETAAPNKVVDIDETPNDHGSKTTVKRVTTYTPTEGEGGSKSSKVTTYVEHGEHVLAANVPTLPAQPTQNEVEEIDIRPNDHGSFSTTKRKTTYAERDAEIEWTGNGGTYKYRSFSHLKTKPTVTTPTGGTAQASISQNEQGSYDGTITTFTPDGGGGTTPGGILKETYDEEHEEEEVLPGGRRRKRTVTLEVEIGFAALSTAMQQMSESKSYKGFRGWFGAIGSRNGQYRKINSISFGSWSYVQ